ncbi:MAG: ferrochelatase [Thermodesulfovibrionales bacterium]|jgi:ferrochelatase
MKNKTIGVILLNLGGPDSIQAVKPFLYNLFSDRQIIRLGPSFMQQPLAWLISTTRSKKTEQYYKLIGGKSPILEITKAQAKALEELLNGPGDKNREFSGSMSFRVYTGMRYWRPFIEDAVLQMQKDGIKKVIALSLYPQYSIATSGSSFSKFNEVASQYNMKTVNIESWHDHPLYIEALVDVIKKGIESFNISSLIPHPSSFNDIHVLFSAHSLPQKIITQGDPYVDQTMGTIQEITKRLNIKWRLSYQSKSGPVKWLAPSTKDKIQELAKEGVKNILMVPISFVSDHIETLYEIDILYKNLAGALGVRMKRTESLNTHPIFIEALKDIVLKSLNDKE